MNKFHSFCAFCAAMLGPLSSVSAQPALERLEKEVHRQLDEGGKPTGGREAADGTREAKPENTPSPVPHPPSPMRTERGYLGACWTMRKTAVAGCESCGSLPAALLRRRGCKKTI